MISDGTMFKRDLFFLASRCDQLLMLMADHFVRLLLGVVVVVTVVVVVVGNKSYSKWD